MKKEGQRHKSTMEVMVMNVFASFGAIYWGYFQCHYNVTQDVYTIMMGIKPED